MRVRLPTPLKGWRVFVGEVGVIVLGVLIALAIGEMADSVRWKILADQSVQDIRSELGRNRGIFEERVLWQQCLDRRLRQLDALLRKAREERRLPDIGPIGIVGMRLISTDAWDQVTGSETLLHLNPVTRKTFASDYSQTSLYFSDIQVERDMWASLSVLSNSPGPISDELLTQSNVTLARLKAKSRSNGNAARQMVESTKRQGIPTSYFSMLDREGTAAEIIAESRTLEICQPLIVNGLPFAA